MAEGWINCSGVNCYRAEGFTVSTSLIPVSEYLKSSYRPDCDYVDGKIEGRNVGEHDHAALQAALILWFGRHQEQWNIEVLPEQRIQISATRFRVPDVCVVSLSDPVEQIITHPPLACIEILSPEDTLLRMRERIEDYRAFGVANIWILDPATRNGYNCTAAGFIHTTNFAVADTPIHLILPELFAGCAPEHEALRGPLRSASLPALI